VCGRTSNGESLLSQVSGTNYNDTGAAVPAAARNLLVGTSVTREFHRRFFTDWGVVFGATISGDQTTGPNANNCSLKVITSGSASSGVICSASQIAVTPGLAYTCRSTPKAPAP
jgi:hypothetical protein